MRELFGFSVPKLAEEPLANADAWRSDPVKGIHVVCDGASECFAPRRWARVLARAYVRRPLIDEAWLAAAIALYERPFDRPAMDWFFQGSYDRGSFSTLLGVQSSGSAVSILGIGDSLAVLEAGGTIQATFPYVDADQFGPKPLLLSTVFKANAPLLADPQSATWDLAAFDRPRLYCMTDGLGAWLLAERDQRMRQLIDLRSPEEFVALVERERASGAMERDDTTLLVLG